MDDNSVRVGKEDSIVIRPIPTNYASNGRIMVISVIILFVALVIIAFFHMYTRWFLVRRSRLSLHAHNQRLRRAHDHHDLPLNSNSIPQPAHGLGPSLLKALPTFLYSPTTHTASLECAVCLSEFQEDETGRILPNCKHSFHLDCIDTWFRTHSNCPLCRAPVQNSDGTVLIIVQIEPQETDANYSGFSPTYQRVEVVQDQVGRFHNSAVPTESPSLVQDRKIPELTIITVETPVISEAQGSSAAGGARSPVCK